ncbi:MAG: PaaI family thioesterase [Trebonia sp.]
MPDGRTRLPGPGSTRSRGRSLSSWPSSQVSETLIGAPQPTCRTTAVKFLRPVTVSTGPITAKGSVIHLGRRTALAEGRITDATGKVYVTATSSCLLLRPEQPSLAQ